MQDWTARSRGGGDDFVNAINTRPVRSNVGRRWRPSKARSSGLRSRFFASSSRGLTNVGRRPLFVVPRIFLEPAYGCYFRRRGDVPRSSSSRCRTSYHPPDYDSGSTPTIVRARKICKPCIRVSVRLFSRLKQWRIAATRRFITPKRIQRIVKVHWNSHYRYLSIFVRTECLPVTGRNVCSNAGTLLFLGERHILVDCYFMLDDEVENEKNLLNLEIRNRLSFRSNWRYN